MREYFKLDTSNYPVVVGTYQDFIPTAEEFRKWQVDVELFNETHKDYVMILDFSNAQNLSIEYRMHAARWASRQDARFVMKNIKIVYYTPSIVSLAILKTVILMAKPKTKYHLVSDLEKGFAWARQQLLEIRQDSR